MKRGGFFWGDLLLGDLLLGKKKRSSAGAEDQCALQTLDQNDNGGDPKDLAKVRIFLTKTPKSGSFMRIRPEIRCLPVRCLVLPTHSLQILLSGVHYILSPYNWRRLWEGLVH